MWTRGRASRSDRPGRADPVAPRLDRLDRSVEGFFEPALADRVEDDAEEPPFQGLAVTDDGVIDLGLAVRLSGEHVGVARLAAPGVRIGGGEDAIRIRPVVVEALPDAAGALGDIGFGRPLAVHFQVAVGAVFEDLRPA